MAGKFLNPEIITDGPAEIFQDCLNKELSFKRQYTGEYFKVYIIYRIHHGDGKWDLIGKGDNGFDVYVITYNQNKRMGQFQIY